MVSGTRVRLELLAAALTLVFLATVAPSAHAAPVPPGLVNIRSISVQEMPEKDSVTIEAEGPVSFHEIKSPNQVIVDIPGGYYDNKGKVQLVLNKTVKLIRTVNIEGNPKIARVMIILNDRFPSAVHKEDHKIRIEIDKTGLQKREEETRRRESPNVGTNPLVEYHYNQGKTFARLGKYGEAVEEYLKALKVDPNNDKVKVGLDIARENMKSEREIDRAIRLYDGGEYGEAIRALNSIVAVWPDDISARFVLGKAYLKVSKYREAMKELELVMKINPDYENVRSLYELAKRRKILNSFSVDVRDQDIVTVLRSMLHGTGFNLLVDDGVKKRISASFAEKTLDEALDEIIVRNGFKYEKGEQTIKIMPDLPLPEDRVFAQMNLTDMELDVGLEVISRMMEKNFIYDDSFDDKLKGKKITLAIKDELTIGEILDLTLKMNDLVALPYNDNTYIIMTRDAALKKNNYQAKTYDVIKVSNTFPSALVNNILKPKAVDAIFNKENITVDDQKMTITIFDTPDKIKLLRTMVLKNDLKTQQVAIAVRILEVTRDAQNKLQFMNMLTTLATQNTKADGKLPSTVDFRNLGKIDLSRLESAITLLESQNEAKVLASPITRVLDQQTATINSGKTIPVRDVQQIPQYEGGKIVGYTSQETFTNAQIGITLQVRPTIHHDGDVTLNVTITNNDADLANLVVGARFVTTGKTTTTTLRLRDGETVLMGGLVNDTSNDVQSQIPFFHRIPIIGRIFRDTSHTNRRIELIIFLTAFLVNKDDVDVALENKMVREAASKQDL